MTLASEYLKGDLANSPEGVRLSRSTGGTIVACDDPEIFFFENLPAGVEYQLTFTGPAGEFSALPSFTEANTRVTIPFPTPPGRLALPAAPGRAHGVSIPILFVNNCLLKVQATCNGASFCRDINGIAGTAVTLLHGLRMV